jgi:hypothetical protein
MRHPTVRWCVTSRINRRPGYTDDDAWHEPRVSIAEEAESLKRDDGLGILSVEVGAALVSTEPCSRPGFPWQSYSSATRGWIISW